MPVVTVRNAKCKVDNSRRVLDLNGDDDFASLADGFPLFVLFSR